MLANRLWRVRVSISYTYSIAVYKREQRGTSLPLLFAIINDSVVKLFRRYDTDSSCSPDNTGLQLRP